MMSGRWDCALVMSILLGCPISAVSQQETPASPDSTTQTPASAPTQTDSQPDQNRKETTANSPPETKPARPAKKHRAAKRAAAPAPDGTPTKIVVREGGVYEPTAQIVTGMSSEEAARERREAELLLSTTAETLKEIAPRLLDGQQQETVSQIHNYMDGARFALREGDIPRAHTLAQKASLLADDLIKH